MRTSQWRWKSTILAGAFWRAVAGTTASLALAFGTAQHVQAAHGLPHASVSVWNVTDTLGTQEKPGFNPGESVEDINGITVHAAAAGSPLTVVATIENTTHPEGPCGLIYWNPATNFFKWYGVTGGSSFGVDLNVSAPTLTGPDGFVFGAPTFQVGDVWVAVNFGGFSPLYVNFKGSNNFRHYVVSGVNGVQIDQSTGRIYFTDLFAGTINRLDPVTNAVTTWPVGGSPHFLALDSAGRVYSAVAGAGVAGGMDAIVRIDPAAATGNVTAWPITGGGLQPGLVFATPDGVAFDSAGNLWFTESVSNEIGRLNPSTGEMCEFTKAGLTNPQLIASSGSGGLLQAFFTEGEPGLGLGNAVSIVTQAEAAPITSPCPTVAPVVSTVTPMTSTAGFTDTIRTPLTATITPGVFDVPGVDGTPSGMTTTADGTPIPGILRFPMPTPPGGNSAFRNFPAGMTGVLAGNSVAGSYLDPDFAGNSAVFLVKSGAIIAPPPGEALKGRMTGGGSVFTADGTRVTHGFGLQCTVTDAPNSLQINWGKGNRFHLESLTAASCTDDPAISPNPPAAGFDTYKGMGTGRYNGVSGATAEWTFADAGEPGKNDMATIVVKDASNAVVLTVTGPLKNGNHQAHNTQ